MNMRIDKDGNLHIRRNDKWKKQACPWLEDSTCGDWCSHFSELGDDNGVLQSIELCHSKKLIGGVLDERDK